MSPVPVTAEWPATGANQRRFLALWSVFALFAVCTVALETVTLVREGGARKPLGWTYARVGDAWTVTDVAARGPAAGLLRVGDVIMQVDGRPGASRIGPKWFLRDSPDRTSYSLTVARRRGDEASMAAISMTIPWPTAYDSGERVWQWIHLGTGVLYLAFGLLVAFARPDSLAAQRVVAVNMLTIGFFFTLVLETDTGIVGHVPLALALGYYFVRPFHLIAGYRFTKSFPVGDQSTPAWRRFDRVFYTVGFLIWLPSVYGGAIRALGPERASAIAVAQYPFSIVHDTLLASIVFLFASVAGIANGLVAWRNYRLLPPGDLQRRLRWVSIGIVIGLLPIVLVGPLLFLRGLAGNTERLALLVHVVNTVVLLLPICMGYAVVKHRVLGIRVVIRAGLRYLLARNVLTFALALPLVFIVLTVLRNPDRSIGELLSGTEGRANLATLALAALTFRFRTPLMTRIDRHFFREAYHRDQIFVALAEAIVRADDIPALARLLSTQLELALHPTRVLALTRGGNGGAARALEVVYSSDGSPGPAALAEFGLPTGELGDVTAVTDTRNIPGLSAEGRQMLDALHIVLVVPIRGPNEGLVGLILLGDKRSEEPYTKDDRSLLDATAAQTGIVWENLALRQALTREQTVRRQLAARLESGSTAVVMECPECGCCFDGDVRACTHDGRALTPSIPGARMMDGKYLLNRVIGRGGMGAVYDATDVRLDRAVAVKVVMGTLFDDAVARQRFAREARASARIVHPNVVSVFDMGEIDGGAYLVLEYLRGRTVRAALDDGPPIDSAQLESVIGQILDGVAAAHAGHVVHRDLKPENIFLVESGDVRAPNAKILDFGLAIARDLEFTDGGKLTRTGTAVGTLAYMSPEQLLGEPVDERTDIHALGIIVLEMLTGSIRTPGPFFARAEPMLAERLPVTSPELQPLAGVLRRAFHQTAESRYPSVDAFRTELFPALHGARSALNGR